MPGSMLRDAFEHHAWATLRLFDACGSLDAERLATSVPGTYGSILDTFRHIVGADASYLFTLTGGAVARIDEERMALPELRSLMEGYGRAWSDLLGRDLEPEAVLVRRRDDGSETHAPVSIRLAQVIHHGTDHRSQICTALTSIGVGPPPIDVWDFGVAVGRVVEHPPTR